MRGMMIWFWVLSSNFAIWLGWIVFYDPVINYLLPLAVGSPGVPAKIGTRFTFYWNFWPIALSFGTLVGGYLASTKRDFYEPGGYP